MSDIDKADRIVGIKEDMWWARTSGYPSQNTYRRGAYCEWLGTPERKKAAKLSLCDFSPLEDIAAEVVRIDAEERRKEPDDGLPPGPWESSFHDSREGRVNQHDTSGMTGPPVAYVYRTDHAVITQYLARCGSPAVRRLLAAYDVTEESKGLSQFSNALCMSDNGNVWLTTSPGRDCRILCWLTPRSKP